MMNVFITGASGFIGSYIIPVLLEQGHKVTAFDIAPVPESLLAYQHEITYMRGDLTDGADLYRAVAATLPSHILHLGSVLAGPCEDSPRKGYAINVNSTLTLLEAAVQFGVKRFVMTSSISVFGRGLDEPVADDADKIPETIYGQTKLACEHLLRWYQDKQLISVAAVRFPWVFGPGRTNGITALWSSKLLDAVAAGKQLIIENPDERGDWLYVHDAVKALMLMLAYDKPQNQCGYNIMGSCHTIGEVMGIVKQIEPDADIIFRPKNSGGSPYPASYSDECARRELGWKPDYTIEEAARDHIRLYRQRNK